MNPMRKQTAPTKNQNMGLIAWLKKTRVILPLKCIHTHFETHGALASVHLEQVYHQDNPVPLDCTYTFPAPAGAAVHRCEVFINDRIIRAKVEDAAQARRIFEQKKKEGHRAALVESNRENLFTLALGNIQPEDLVVVRLSWIQMLDRTEKTLRLRIPTCPGIRYIPGNPIQHSSNEHGLVTDTERVPDASQINPPRIDALHPDAAYFSVSGSLRFGEFAEGSVSSPSHLIVVRPDLQRGLRIGLAAGSTSPDADFILTWALPQESMLAPKLWRWEEDRHTYALVELRAPNVADSEMNRPQDYYFLVDRSGSMAGGNWKAACAALHGFVRHLGPEDRVWLTHFESDFSDFSEVPMPADQLLQDPQFIELDRLPVGGGTELLPAAEHVLAKIRQFSPRRRVSVVLLTDGQVGNEGEILQAFRRMPRVRVHTFGIDRAVNDAFLKALARQQHGGCWLQTPDDDIPAIVAALGGRLKRPVLIDLSIEGEWETAGQPLPDLHAEEVVTLCLRTARKAESLAVRATLPNGEEQRLELANAEEGSEAVKLMWAREKIGRLLATKRPKRAVEIAKQFNLACEGASFVAWDEAESVFIASQNIHQPSLQPSGFASHALSDFEQSFAGTFVHYVPLIGGLLSRKSKADVRTKLNDSSNQNPLHTFTRAVKKRMPSALRHVENWPAYQWATQKLDLTNPLVCEIAGSAEWFVEWLSHPLLKQKGLGGLRSLGRSFLSGSQQEFLNAVSEFRLKWDLLKELSESLRKQSFISNEQFSAVMAWITEDPSINEQRLELADVVSERLDDLYDSGGDPEPMWVAFLNTNGVI